MSCLVGSIRVKMLRRLTSMVSRFSARAQEFDLVEFADQIVEEGLHLVLRGRLGALRHRERQLAAGRELEPFVADQQHRLRQVERGEAGIDRKSDDAVGERDLLVLQPVALAAEQDADLAAGRDMGHDLAAPPPPARPPAWPGRGRARWWRTAASNRRPPPRRYRTARPAPGSGRRRPPRAGRAMFGQPSRGLTIRSRDSAKLPIARAAMPIFSPSCGSTRITTGPAKSRPALVLSVPDPDITSLSDSSAGDSESTARQASLIQRLGLIYSRI